MEISIRSNRHLEVCMSNTAYFSSEEKLILWLKLDLILNSGEH